MTSSERRKELRTEYRGTAREAGVYRILNTRTGRSLLASTPDLASIRNRVEFARSTNSTGALDGRLAADIREFGIKAFEFEVLEALDTADRTPREAARDLTVLEVLWREKFGSAEFY